MAYLVNMAPRLQELHRVLKPTGSLYLHCDPTMSHYLKTLLDAIFGPVNFRSEIIWKRSSAHNGAKRWGPVHDVILFYSKGNTYTWNQLHSSYEATYIDVKYRKIDKATGRRYTDSDLTGAGIRSGESGMPWRGIDPTAKGRHWAVPRGVSEAIKGLSTLAALDALDAEGRILWGKRGAMTPRYKRFLDDMPGVPVQDVWTDVDPLNSRASERLGYPTQKPLTLLERILKPTGVSRRPERNHGYRLAPDNLGKNRER